MLESIRWLPRSSAGDFQRQQCRAGPLRFGYFDLRGTLKRGSNDDGAMK
jgi:hypothetical protein